MKSVDEILALDDAHRELVPVPEWGESITVCSMTGEERADIERMWANRQASSDPAQFRADVLARTLKNGEGKPWCTFEQARSLLRKNAGAVERLFSAACRLSGLSKADVEELEKN